MFQGGDPSNGLSKAVRVGFFAQRFDLPAAGCRPDIENDEEYSSYFWGAFLGRSRTGKLAEGVDCDLNGLVSGRRDFQREIIESWPDLENPMDWNDLPWLRGEEGDTIFDELRQLPSFGAYQKSVEDRRLSRERATDAELKGVQFRRLVHTLESVVLAQNLPRLVTPELLNRFQAIIDLESSLFNK